MILYLRVSGAAGDALGESAYKTFVERGGTIGRDDGNDWVLTDPSVSAFHALIRYADQQFTIEDLSTSGIVVNGGTPLAPGARHVIEEGDLFRIGVYTIEAAVRPILWAAPPPDAAEPPGAEPPSASPSSGAAPPDSPPDSPPPSATMAPPAPAPPAMAPPAAASAGPRPVSFGTSGTAPAAPAAPRSRGLSAEADGSRDRYTVWFGTNRRPDIAGDRVTFTAERDRTVHHGWCRVAVPRSHKIGSVGSPWWKRLVTMTDDRLKIVKTMLLDREAFWDQIAAGLRETPIEDRDAVVFLHGFNVSFEEAALRAAQLGFDLGINGLMAFYSWPSQGNIRGYTTDEATIEASEGFIADFLTDMATRSGAARVHVIAHSMGNRGLLRAIDRMAATAAERSHTPFDQIVLAAPDVDYDTFRRLSVAYQRVARRTTLYVCAKDRAVEASEWVHSYARAGLVPPVTIVPGIDTINVSNLDLTLLGHGYVAEARELLTDMHTLLRHGTPPDQRFGLTPARSDDGTYWLVGG